MPQSLCHGMSEMPSVTPIGLNSASMRLFARLRPNSCPAPGIVREVEEAGVFEQRTGTVAIRGRSPACARGGCRRRRCAPTTSGRRLRCTSAPRGPCRRRSRPSRASENSPSMCRKPGGLEEVAHLVAVVVGAERAREIERAAVAVVEARSSPACRSACRRARRARRATSRGGGRRCRRGWSSAPRGPQAHERLLVVDEVGELLARRARTCAVASASRAARDRDAPVVGGQRPRLAVDFDRHRPGPHERKRGNDRVGMLVESGGQVVAEERVGIEVGPGSVDPGAYVDRHGLHARPSRRSAARTPRLAGTIASAGGIGPPALPGVHSPGLARRPGASAARRTRAVPSRSSESSRLLAFASR